MLLETKGLHCHSFNLCVLYDDADPDLPILTARANKHY